MIQFVRILQAGMRNFMRNAWLSTAATAVMTVTLTIVVISFISNLALNSTIQSVTNKIDVSIYLKDSLTQTQTNDLKSKIEQVDNVQSVTYRSKDEALALYKKQIQDNSKLLAGINAAGINPLPASFQLKLKSQDPKKLQALTAFLNQPEVKDAQSDPPSYSGKNKEAIDRIVSSFNFFKTGGLIASIFFIIISVLIIFNTIRMAIFTRREEIEIMKLVGATKWFIRGPFIVEAAFYGIIAAIIALGLSYAALVGGSKIGGSYIDFSAAMNFFRSYPFVIIGAEFVIGILIGAFSSVMAMSRYLKL